MKDTEDGHLFWRETGRKTVYTGSIFSLTEAQHTNTRGDQGTFLLIESPDWVNVIPVVTDEQGNRFFVMVRQYRHGAGQVALEFPGGLIDPGESAREAAGRELLEETGYSSKNLIDLGSMNPNPAFMTNRLHTFLAEDLGSPAGQNLDKLEVLDVELVPEDEILSGSREDFLVNGVMMIHLFLYNRYYSSRGGKR